MKGLAADVDQDNGQFITKEPLKIRLKVGKKGSNAIEVQKNVVVSKEYYNYLSLRRRFEFLINK